MSNCGWLMAWCGSGFGWFSCFQQVRGLEVHVERAGFLALDGPERGVDAAEDAAAGRGVAAEGVRAGLVGGAAVRALGAVADAEEVPEGQLHQRAEAVRAGQGVLGQHGAARVVGRQLRGKGFRVQAAELHVQLGLVSALCVRGAVPRHCRVELPRAGQAQHDGAVPLRGRKGHEDRGAVADAVGVRLLPHGLPDLVGARDVPAARFGVVQHLSRRCFCFVVFFSGFVALFYSARARACVCVCVSLCVCVCVCACVSMSSVYVFLGVVSICIGVPVVGYMHALWVC